MLTALPLVIWTDVESETDAPKDAPTPSSIYADPTDLKSSTAARKEPTYDRPADSIALAFAAAGAGGSATSLK